MPGTESVSEQYFLGVDGSGRTTQAVVADRTGKLLGRGIGPPCDPQKFGFEKMEQALTTAIEGAIGQVGRNIPREGHAWRHVRMAAACFGLSGLDSREDQERARAWVQKVGIAERFKVVNDSEVILEAGTSEGWGVALICSTGSICLGRTREGRIARAGGWGHIFGDEGSGYQIAVETLRLASQAADGRADAAGVLRTVLNHWQLLDADQLFGHVYRPEFTPHDIAELASQTTSLANRGDAAAQQVVDRASAALALHVDTVVRKLGLKKPPLALGGGILWATLRKPVVDKITAELGPVTNVQDPAQGAVTVARRLAGVA
jgi:N-acetylglucosamine kinase-like BadF-type ATPase